APLLDDDQVRSVVALLDIAAKYPADAPALRRQAWMQAERTNSPTVWYLIAEDAAKRGDAETTSRAAQQALATNSGNETLAVHRRIRVITALLQVNLRDQAAKAIDPWLDWAADKRGADLSNLLYVVAPILVDLGRESEIVPAANQIAGYFARSQAISKVAELLFRAGRRTEAERVDAMAVAVAQSTRYDDKRDQRDHDAAFHNLALARSHRGDIRGALEMVSDIGDGVKMREVTSYVVRAALDGGYGAAAVPAIDRLAALARASGSARALIEAASASNRIGQKDKARDLLAEGLALDRRGAKPRSDLSAVAEPAWKIDGDPDAALALAETSASEPRRASAIERLIGLIAPSSPAAALKMAGRLSDPNHQIGALSYVAAAL